MTSGYPAKTATLPPSLGPPCLPPRSGPTFSVHPLRSGSCSHTLRGPPLLSPRPSRPMCRDLLRAVHLHRIILGHRPLCFFGCKKKKSSVTRNESQYEILLQAIVTQCLGTSNSTSRLPKTISPADASLVAGRIHPRAHPLHGDVERVQEPKSGEPGPT